MKRFDETPKHPSLNLAYTITLPTASVAKTLGTGRVDHKIVGDLERKVSKYKTRIEPWSLFAGRKGRPDIQKLVWAPYLSTILSEQGLRLRTKSISPAKRIRIQVKFMLSTR